MALFSSAELLCVTASLLVAVVSGTSHYGYEYGRARQLSVTGKSGGIFNRYYDNAARAMQVDSAQSCAVSGAHEVCHTAELESDFPVHVCPKDGLCDQTLCYYSSVPPCCSNAVGLECHSVTTLLIEGKKINVTHYRIPLANGQVCISISPAVDVCDDACKPPCRTVECTQNLECDSNGANCRCKEGFTEESECCDCAEDYYKNGTRCIKFCRDNCRNRAPDENNELTGQCISCFGDYLPPTCCNCPPDREEIDRVCKCRPNLNPDGTCVEGALAPDCCECDTTGNATHGFYKTPDGKCKPFCKNNCAETGSSGCIRCRTGFAAVPECCRCGDGLEEINGECKCRINTHLNGSCIVGANPQNCCDCLTGYQKNPTTGKCEPEKCDKQQTLYFYIDATDSNTFENFCPLIVVMQMLVAAFNPSATSGTKINALLFPDNQRQRDPSPVFDIGTSCLDATQGKDRSLLSLLSEFGVCIDKSRNYDSLKFPSSCGEGTSAVRGLEEIYRLASSTSSSTESAVLMLTDGVIIDDSTSRTTVLNNLKSAGVSTLIAAGINDGTSVADRENLKDYTSEENIVVKDDPVNLGIAIVRKLEERGILCKDHADNITNSLNNSRGDQIIGQLSTLTLFCRCHRTSNINGPVCSARTKKYPTCGGDLSIGIPVATTPELDSQLSLEEEILAAVENVLESFEEGHHN